MFVFKKMNLLLIAEHAMLQALQKSIRWFTISYSDVENTDTKKLHMQGRLMVANSVDLSSKTKETLDHDRDTHK